MAKVKKDKIAIEDILLPIDEHPYEIPQNWCWVKHNGVLDISGGSQPAKSYFISEPTEGYIKLYQTRDYGDNPVPVYIPEKYATKTTLEGDILLARYGGSLGKVFRAHEGAYNVALAKVIKLYPDLIDDEYLYKYYFTQFYQDFCVKASKGRSAQAGFNRDDMNNIPFPLPPLAEQRRIVEQIESLFTKLDEAKEKAQEVIDGYEARNAAVYNAAFSGRLTAQWRKDNYKGNKWETKRFDEVANIKSNLVDPSAYLEYPHIAPDNIEKRTGILLDYHTIAEDGVKSGKHRFYAGQILYSKIRPYLSKVVMVDFDGLCSADMYPIEAKENTKYLLYYMLSDMFLEQASSAGSRSVLPKINQKELSAIKVRITSAEEQEEVVRILDYILPMMQQVRDKAIQVVDNIDIMKKSILAKAFRGELGTNIPEDESAIELLKIILDKGDVNG